MGFKLDSNQIAWVGWFLAGIVTIVELVFNSQTGKLSLTLIVTGALCYMYGIWTNITGFWSLQHPDQPFVLLNTISILPIFVGSIMEVLPEPLFMWGMMSAMDGDFLGNLVGLWSGKLSYAEPANETPKQQPQQNQPRREMPSSLPRRETAHFEPEKDETADVPDFLKHPRPAPRPNNGQLKFRA
jgi:hypothetical protein